MPPRAHLENAEPLPSLNALLAFEAAARHLSFTRAARELGVTQTAISHQVRSLEDELGLALFSRSPRGLRLTADGEKWSAEVGAVFTRLRDANARLRRPRQSERPVVSVSIVPSFGARWLVPRLGRFLVEHPDIDVRLSATERLVDFAVEPVDIAIRYGRGDYAGLVCQPLVIDAFIVVAAPSVAQAHSAWRLEHLSAQALLHDDFPDAWERWFAARSRALPARVRQNQISDSSMLVEAALRGQGVALVRWSLALDELEAGRLVRLFPKLPPFQTGLAYHLVGPRERLRLTAVAAFRRWVLSEAEKLRLPS
jgi:LysR family transcriptional regulator, glycine cleavage system transcriptional activator